MASMCRRGINFCKRVGGCTPVLVPGALPAAPGPKGKLEPFCWGNSIAARGLSSGAIFGLMGANGSPRGDCGRDSGCIGDAPIRAAMNLCCCSGDQTEGSGPAPAPSPAFSKIFLEGLGDGDFLFAFGEGPGEGERRMGLDISVLSSPKKLRDVLGTLARGGSIENIQRYKTLANLEFIRTIMQICGSIFTTR